MIDPNGFIITRKRKKYKFAHFANADNCFEFANWSPLDQKGLIVEIGAGTALFLVELASRVRSRSKEHLFREGSRRSISRCRQIRICRSYLANFLRSFPKKA